LSIFIAQQVPQNTHWCQVTSPIAPASTKYTEYVIDNKVNSNV